LEIEHARGDGNGEQQQNAPPPIATPHRVALGVFQRLQLRFVHQTARLSEDPRSR